jgi:hypothetical protein
MATKINYADEFAAKLRPASSIIAMTYGILDPAAVDAAVDEISIGNDEPEAVLPEDQVDASYPVVALHDALVRLDDAMFLVPGVMDGNQRVTVSMLASTTENADVDQLARIAEALNRSVPTINLAKVRQWQVDPRRALLVAKMATGGQCWRDWQNEDPTGGFVETDEGLIPEPGTAIAFIVDCLKAAGCTYSNKEIRDAIPAMMDALGITVVTKEEPAVAAA